jgi:uncharacterized membrane protein YgdD (TMEM256/DUF423 family)
MDLRFVLASALSGALGVLLGAFGAHALRDRMNTDMLAVFETGVRYQMYHAIALLGVAALVVKLPGSGLPAMAGWLFIAGMVLFSGSLYALTLSGQRWMGAITPLGGAAFVAGWVLLAAAALRALRVAQAVP